MYSPNEIRSLARNVLAAESYASGDAFVATNGGSNHFFAMSAGEATFDNIMFVAGEFSYAFGLTNYTKKTFVGWYVDKTDAIVAVAAVSHDEAVQLAPSEFPEGVAGIGDSEEFFAVFRGDGGCVGVYRNDKALDARTQTLTDAIDLALNGDTQETVEGGIQVKPLARKNSIDAYVLCRGSYADAGLDSNGGTCSSSYEGGGTYTMLKDVSDSGTNEQMLSSELRAWYAPRDEDPFVLTFCFSRTEKAVNVALSKVDGALGVKITSVDGSDDFGSYTVADGDDQFDTIARYVLRVKNLF